MWRWLALCALAGCAAVVDPPPDIADARARAGRGAWVVAEVDRWNAWLSDDDRAAKYSKMEASPFAFFRGTNHLFWHDMAGRADLGRYGSPRTLAWVQGDAHADNLGTFDDDRGVVVYDLNDFDEAWLADYQLDLWRLATSVVLLADEEGADAQEAVDALARGYLDAMHDFHGNDDETHLEFDESETDGAIADLIHDVTRKRSRQDLLDEWTDGAGHLDTTLSDLEPVSDAEAAAVRAALPDHDVADVARRRNAGLGSLGVRRYYVLTRDDVILDVKEERGATAAAYVPAPALSGLAPAARAKLGMRALGIHVDDQLDGVWIDGRSYLVRALSPWKNKLSAKRLAAAGALAGSAAQWGRILAAAHARADKDFDPDLISHSLDKQIDEITDGDKAGFRALVWARASSYAKQVRRDYQAFMSR